MEDAENPTASMLLNEVMEGDVSPSEETGSIAGEGAGLSPAAEATESLNDDQSVENEEASADVSCPNDQLATDPMDVNSEGFIGHIEDENPEEGVVERHEGGIEMMDEDVENPAEDVVNDDEATDPEHAESMELHGDVPSEDFAGVEFMSQTSAMIVQNEPPQQLMEEADTPGEGEICEGAEDGEGGVPATDTQAADSDGAFFEFVGGEPSDALEEHGEEGDTLQQEEEMDHPAVLDSHEAMSGHEEIEQQPIANPSEGEADSLLENQAPEAEEDLSQEGELSAEEGLSELPDAEHGDENMSAPHEDSAPERPEGFTILAGADQLEGSLGGLEGKLVVGSDGTVHLITPESLQGMQLMEGDDKPEDLVNGEDAVAQMQQDIRAQLHEALLKQEEIKQEQEDRPQGEDSSPQEEPNSESDALATLASAALGHQAPANGVKNEPDAPEVKPDLNEPQWMDVGICKGTHCVVRSFYIPSEGQSWDKNWEGINTSTLPDHRALEKLQLEAGKAYKFRVAAINSCGRGPWSEVSAFRTSMPGVPGAPSAIKISKTVEGAHLSWEPPSAASGLIEDYTVYMAVRSATTTESQVVSSGANQLAFVRIYQGAENQCSVGFETLNDAHIDTTSKPAILFRIAARNEKGLGPAIQVRWLQDGSIPNNTKPANAVRRVGSDIKPHGNIKRKKSECE